MTFTSRDIVELVSDRAAAAYAVSSNPEMRVWQFNGEYTNDLAIDEFANQVSNIEIIDQYSGSIPELFSLETIRDRGVNIRVDRTLLLDSNVANYTRKFIAGRLVGDFEKSVAALIGWYARREMSVHPGFSLMETISGGMNNVVHGEELVRMALLLSGMDREAFLNRGELKLEAAGYRDLMQRFKTHDLDRAAAIEFASLPKATRETVDRSYAALLKIALVGASNRGSSIAKKVDEFMTFLENELQMVLTVEVAVAVLFFAGKIGKFIPLSTKKPFEERLENVRSSAWDAFFVRMAPNFIQEADEKTLILPILVTADKNLRGILRSQTIGGVVCFNNQPPRPVVGFDFEYLKSVTPSSWDSSSLEQRLRSRDVSINRTLSVDLAKIIDTLEREARECFSEDRGEKDDVQ